MAEELQLENADQGVVVLDVDAGSYASNVGFRRGDIIESVNDQKIDKTSELESFSRIPLRIAQAVVNVPTEIIQLRINDVTDQTTLANRQMDLIVALAGMR